MLVEQGRVGANFLDQFLRAGAELIEVVPVQSLGEIIADVTDIAVQLVGQGGDVGVGGLLAREEILPKLHGLGGGLINVVGVGAIARRASDFAILRIAKSAVVGNDLLRPVPGGVAREITQLGDFARLNDFLLRVAVWF